jgi:hypothetical protein
MVIKTLRAGEIGLTPGRGGQGCSGLETGGGVAPAVRVRPSVPIG